MRFLRSQRILLGAVLFGSVSVSLGALGQSEVKSEPPPPNTYRIVWLFDTVGAQKLVNADSRSFEAASYKRTPVFRLQLSETFEYLDFKPDSSDRTLWRAEKILPLEAPDPSVRPRLFLLVADAGADAPTRKLVGLLQDLWAEDDPFPLILAAPAFDQPGLDPRYDKITRTLTIRFP